MKNNKVNVAIEELFGSIPTGWKYKTLAAACAEGGGDIQTGPFGSQLHAADYVPVGIPSIMPKNIGDNRLHEEGIARITPEDAQRLSRYLVRTGDIVYSRRGDVERRALVRAHEDGWLCGTGCLRVCLGEKGADPTFVSHYLGHPSVREWIIRHAHGATMPNLNTSILGACPFLEPPIQEQRAIAHILGTLEDKIELNRKQNETLEAMARALFKAWFVDFEPVRAKMDGRWQRGQSLSGLPAHLYDLFPDRLVESELGEIPEGWEPRPLDMLLDTTSQRIAVSDLTPESYISTENMVANRGGVVSASSLPSAATVPSFTSGDVLVSNIRPYFKKIWFAWRDGGRSADVLAFRFKDRSYREFLYSLLSQDEFFDFMMQTSKGAKMPRGDKGAIMARLFSYPGQELCAAFSEAVKPFYSCVQVATHENIQLADLRDTLLPKLISGELRVADAKPMLENLA